MCKRFWNTWLFVDLCRRSPNFGDKRNELQRVVRLNGCSPLCPVFANLNLQITFSPQRSLHHDMAAVATVIHVVRKREQCELERGERAEEGHDSSLMKQARAALTIKKFILRKNSLGDVLAQRRATTSKR